MNSPERKNETGESRRKEADVGKIVHSPDADRLKDAKAASPANCGKMEAAADLRKGFSGDALLDRNRFGGLAAPEQARRNEDHAREFVSARVNDPAKIDEALSGMNFSREVREVTLRPGDIVYRHQSREPASPKSSDAPSRNSLQNGGDRPPEGGWFAMPKLAADGVLLAGDEGGWFAPGGSTAERLGIVGITADSVQRRNSREAYVVTREVTVLVSTAKDVPSWYKGEAKGTAPDGSVIKGDNGKQTGELLFGGGVQFFAGDRKEDLSAFSRVVDPQRKKKESAS